MRFFILAGEPSGDIHAAKLITALTALDPDATFAGLGGDRMRDAGCKLYQDYRTMAFMGYAAVAKNLSNVRRNFQLAHEALLHEHPDVLVLIDYPTFNLRMAEYCRKHLPHTRIYYYIPPKVWAWKRYRIHRIAHLTDGILGIFPFEPKFYHEYGYTCHYVGNPTLEEVREYLQQHPTPAQQPAPLSDATPQPQDTPYIAILPGSRPSEISHCLPKMLEAARRFPKYKIRVAAAPGVKDDFYAKYLDADTPLVREPYPLLQNAYAAIVNSGTATLEAALLNCPQVAVYHVDCPRLFTLFWKMFFKLRRFTLPNIILGRTVIKEKLATHFTVDEVAHELNRLLENESYRHRMLANYAVLERMLGLRSASTSAAQYIIDKTNRLKKKKIDNQS